MSFSWKESSEPKEGAQRAPSIPAGRNIQLKVDRVIFSAKGGGGFVTKDNDPQIMVIFTDTNGNEASEMITLSEKAAFKLSQILRASGADLDRMDAQGVTPEQFAYSEFCDRHLVGRKFVGDKSYARVYPLIPRTNQQPSAQQKPVVNQDRQPARQQPAFNPNSNREPQKPFGDKTEFADSEIPF